MNDINVKSNRDNRFKFQLLIMGFLAFGLFFIQKDLNSQALTVKGTVLYNPFLGECFQETPCLDAIDLTHEEDWIPPKAAVNIAVKGTDVVVKTDRKGNYELTVPSPDASLMFMFIGHNRIEVPVNGRTTVDVKLTPTPLPVIDRLLGFIMPDIFTGIYPDIDTLAQKANVGRETARDLLWLVIGNRRMVQYYPDEYIPDYRFED